MKMKPTMNVALQARTAVKFVTCVYCPGHPMAEGVADFGDLVTTYFGKGTKGTATICLMTGMVMVTTFGASDVTESTAVGGRLLVSTAAASLLCPLGTGLGRL